ncbi:MAG TPA: proprotein convertase P-domain-containing protein [Thermoanaerobaculia bacterium]|jgi:subtilisin-like proprotein convertase family protein|nr:proprotein convertase P-domain-containing protein [Thermoanaerobaculia bacterium]
MRTALLALLFAANLHAADFRLDRQVESLTGTHRHYTQYIDGLPVDGAARVESVLLDGRVRAEERAARAPLAASAKRSAPRKDATLVYLNVDGEARLAWRYVTSDHFAHWMDASSGETLRTEQLFWTAQARVFDVNPVAKLNNPALRDQNDSPDAVPAAAYDLVDLQDLNASGSLGGPNAIIVDAEGPPVTPAEVTRPLLFDRGESGFEDVNAYFQIDRSLRYIQSLGYTGARRIIAYPIPVDPHGAGGADNSYYIPSAVAGRGTLFFGEGGTDDAEDSDIMLHELGHAIQDWIAPGTFGGASSSESRAMGEGFGDYWSFSSTYQATVRSGRDPFCIADWDARCAGDDSSEQCGYAAGADCLRRVDSSKTMADYIRSETAGTEHRNGEIWSSALRELFLAIGRQKADTIVLEAHFGVAPNPTFAVMAKRMLDADRLLYGGANAAAICTAMTRRGIAADCTATGPRGELTWLESSEHGMAIPDADAAGITSSLLVTDTRLLTSLAVHVDIAHPARGDLRIVLTAPDGTQVLLQDSSLDRTPNLRGTFGADILPAQPLSIFSGRSAIGTWKLTVSDLLARDSGTLVSWSLVARFAGDEPLPSRPIALSGFPSRFIPVVASLPGVGGSQWASDVHLLNRGPASVFVTLVFTPSGADGYQTFSAIKTEIPSGQTVVLEDVVAQLFGTTGSGALELQGDVRRLVIWSNTYDRTRGIGQSVRAVASGESIGRDGTSVYLARDRDRRMNVGVAEINGAAGTARIRVVDPSGVTSFVRETFLPPFSHFQIPIDAAVGAQSYIAVDVIAGDARVVAYGSYVDPRSGDPLFIRAARAPQRSVAIPAAIDAPGAFGSQWETSLTYLRVSESGVATISFYPAAGPPPTTNTVIGALFAARYLPTPSFGHLELDLPGGGILSSNLVHEAAGGTFGEHIDEVRLENAIGIGGAADTVNITGSAEVRTNFGVAEVAGGSATVEVRLLDAAGSERARTTLTVGPHQLLQLPLTTSIVHGVLDFRVTAGDGRVIPYASVVNNVTNDFFFLLGE